MLIQLSGQGLCSAALPWLLDAQSKCEPVAWIGGSQSRPFAPDLVSAGVDLRRLLWVEPEVERPSQRAQTRFRATELLLRSGAFGCVVVDLSDVHGAKDVGWLRKTGWQSRIAALARKHQSAVLLLAYDASEASLGALIGVRIAYAQGHGQVLRNKTASALPAHLLRIAREDPDGVLFATIPKLTNPSLALRTQQKFTPKGAEHS